jgi:hypothetical protein
LARAHFDIRGFDVSAAAIGVEKRKDVAIVGEPLPDAGEQAWLSGKL